MFLWYIDAMGLKRLALVVLLLTLAQLSAPAFGQTSVSSGVKKPSSSASSGSAAQSAGGSTAKGDCNGAPCEQDQRPPVIVTLPAPAPEVWSWYARVQWAASVMLSIVAYAGIMLALRVMKKIERLTTSMESAAASTSLSAEAALLNAQAIHDSQRPWLLITARADCSATIPKRAISHGCLGMRGTGRSTSEANSCHLSANGRISLSHARPSIPSESLVSSRSRSSITAVPSSRGCAKAAEE